MQENLKGGAILKLNRNNQVMLPKEAIKKWLEGKGEGFYLIGVQCFAGVKGMLLYPVWLNKKEV